MKKQSKITIGRSIFALAIMLVVVSFVNCDSKYEDPSIHVDPPKEGVETSITSYFPDSGGIATQLILYGDNFGTDTSYIKVTVNDNNARVIGSDGKAILAIVPARADTGFVKVYIGKEPNIKTLTYDLEFKYHFNRNVTTHFGQNGQEGTTDGAYREAKLRRPWFVIADKDGALYSIDEGRGNNSDGGLRRAYEGMVTTLKRNIVGPMQSPTGLAFNPTQDTLYMVNSLWNANNMITDAAVAIFTRAAGFTDVKPFVRAIYTKCTTVAVHPTNGDIFFNSQVDGNIYKYNRTTKEHELQLQLNGTDTELRMLFSRDGKTVYAVVKNKHCIYKLDYNTTTRKLENSRLWVGEWNISGFQNGLGTVARFRDPGHPAEDDKGNLLVPDKNNHCIRIITPAGLVSTYAGEATKSGYRDGDPSTALFKEPEGVGFAPDEALYVADRGNQVVRRILVE